MRFIVTVFALCLFLCGRTAHGSRCVIPADWRGQYFQSGLGTVIVRKGLITTKGSCVDQHRDYYLFANREHNCFQCLLMIRRHANIIQYKESFCLTPDTLKNICTQIRVETPLYTLVRDPAIPTQCPFQDAYYFNYNDVQHSLCDQPLSYAKPCVGATKYLFHFQHCQQTASLHAKDVDVECLATWKDGSESYLYSRVITPGVNVKDDQYRCFNYQHYGSEVFMSMSADATCRGLRNARDGQFVLELTKDAFGFPTPSCRFPDWLRNVTWRDLEGRHQFLISDNEGQILSEFLVKKSGGTTGAQLGKRFLQTELKCTEVFQRVDRDVTLRSLSVFGCASKYQCLRIKQKSSSIFEMHKGVMSDVAGGTQCTVSDQYQTLITSNVMETACPLAGQYQSTSRDGCVHRLNVGCGNASSVIDFIPGCDDVTNDTAATVTLECVTSWHSNDRWFVVVKDAKSTENQLYNCLSLVLNSQRTVVLELDRTCNRDTPAITTALVGATFNKIGSCTNASPGGGDTLAHVISQQMTSPAPGTNRSQLQQSVTETSGSRDLPLEADGVQNYENSVYDNDEDENADAEEHPDDDFDENEEPTYTDRSLATTARSVRPLLIDIYAVSNTGAKNAGDGGKTSHVIVTHDSLPVYSNKGVDRSRAADDYDGADEDYDDDNARVVEVSRPPKPKTFVVDFGGGRSGTSEGGQKRHSNNNNDNNNSSAPPDVVVVMSRWRYFGYSVLSVAVWKLSRFVL